MVSTKTKIRNIIYVVLVVIFFITATIIAINLANGKRLNDEGEVVDTSVIRLNTSPEDITAYINDERVRIVENRIQNVIPGEMILRLEKEGYTTWEKTIKTEPGLVKDIYARLYPENLDFEQITNTNVDNIFFSLNTDFVFYTVLNAEIKSEIGIWKLKISRNILGIGSNTPEYIANFDSTTLELLKEQNYNLTISPDNNRLIMDIPDEKILRIYNTNSNSEYIDLVKELGYYPTKYTWFRNSDALVIQKDDLLFEYEIASKQSNLIHYFNSEDPIYGVSNNQVYFYRIDENSIYEYINKTSEFVKLPKLFEIPQDITNIVASTYYKDLFILETETTKYIFDLDRDFIDNFGGNSEFIDFSNNARSVIYKDSENYYTYTLENTFNNESYISKTNQIDLNSENITGIKFTPEGGNIIVIINNEVTDSLWITDNDGQNPREIISEQLIVGSSAQTSNDGNNLFVLLEDPLLDEQTEANQNIFQINLESPIEE